MSRCRRTINDLDRERSKSDIPRLLELRSAVKMEIDGANGQEEMFLRSSTGLSSIVKELAKEYGKAYFRFVLRDVFEQDNFYDDKASPEQAMVYARTIIKRLSGSLGNTPSVLCACCAFVLEEFNKAFPESNHANTIVVGSLIFLRILSPALIKPEMFGFKPHTSQSVATCVQIARLLQITLKSTVTQQSASLDTATQAFILQNQPMVSEFLEHFPYSHICSRSFQDQTEGCWREPTHPVQCMARRSAASSYGMGSSSQMDAEMMAMTKNAASAPRKRRFSLKFWKKKPAKTMMMA